MPGPSSSVSDQDAPALPLHTVHESSGYDTRPVPPWLVFTLVLGTGLVVATYIVALVYHRRVDAIGPVMQLVHLGRESNVPTWWNSLLLAGAGATALFAAALTPRGASPGRRSLAVIAAVAFFMSVDEASMLHERLSGPAIVLLDRLGIDFPTFKWVALGAPLGLAVMVGLLWWTFRVPKDVGLPVLLGAAVYGMGALGFESVSGVVRDDGWSTSLAWWTAVEETCEMAGCLVVIFGLLRLFRVVRLNDSLSIGHRASFIGGRQA